MKYQLLLLTIVLVCCEITRAEKVWVFFKDKKCENSKIVQLDQHTIQRRSINNKNNFQTEQHTIQNAPKWEDVQVCEDYIQQIIEKTGSKIISTSRWLNAITIDLTSSCNAKNLKNDILKLPFVSSLEIVGKYHHEPSEPTEKLDDDGKTNNNNNKVQTPQANSWDYGLSLGQLEQINVPEVHKLGINGSGVRILVLDSGFLVSHPALSSAKIISMMDFVNDSKGAYSTATTHGTATSSCIAGFVSGTMIGVSPGVELLLARTEDVSSEYQGEEDNFISALEWGESLGADIASASLGYSDWYVWANMSGQSLISKACDIAFNLGMVVVVSAGNYGIFGVGAPADSHMAISVGAVTSKGILASFSSIGPTSDMRIKPEVCAQGANVYTAIVPSRYGYMSGTSFSCPLVAGVCALILSAHRNWTARMIRESLVFTSSKSNTPDSFLGFGIVNASKAIEYSPILGSNCTEYGCSNSGSCGNQDGECVCNNGFYGTRCEFRKVKCVNYCNLTFGTCQANEWCACKNGDSPSVAGITCELGIPSFAPHSSFSLSSAFSSVSNTLSILIILILYSS